MTEIKGCPECKFFSLELIDPYFLIMGQLLKKYKCSECGYEEIKEVEC